MFSNIGGKIKALAKVIFVLTFIAALGGALTAAIFVGKEAARSCGGYTGDKYSFDSYRKYQENKTAGFFAGAGVFIAVAGIGFVTAWIGSFFMYGYGQLIEDSELNRKTSQEILQKLQSAPAPKPYPSDDTPKTVPKAYPPIVESPKSVPKTAPLKKPVIPTPDGDDKVVCPVCKEKQPAGRALCRNCGTKFISVPKDPAIRNYRDLLETAAKFHTDDGMIDYLRREMKNLPDADRKQVDEILAQPPHMVRKTIGDVLADEPPIAPEPVPSDSMWYCSQCGTKNADGKFCKLCGAPKN